MARKPFEDTAASAIEAAARLLTRREHGERELRQKMARKGYSSAVLDEAIDALLERDWLNEARYAASMARHRAAQGRGPRWVRSELGAQGIAEADLQAALNQDEVDWQQACLYALWRMGPAQRPDHEARCRQKLYQRGFDSEHISAALRQQQIDGVAD